MFLGRERARKKVEEEEEWRENNNNNKSIGEYGYGRGMRGIGGERESGWGSWDEKKEEEREERK